MVNQGQYLQRTNITAITHWIIYYGSHQRTNVDGFTESVRAIKRHTKDQTQQQQITKFFNRKSTRRKDGHIDQHDYQIPLDVHKQPQRRPIQTTQQLLTEFFRERAPNTNNPPTTTTSPSAPLVAKAGYLHSSCPKLSYSI
jgi:hypothetical protein